MNDPERFDAVVIGTGQAGKPLAGALAGAGKKTAIVERDRVGGTCILTGCTPTKTMVASARVAHLARRGRDFGVVTEPVSIEMEEVRRRKRKLVDSWSSGNRKQLEETDGVELIFGEASFTGPRALEVKLADGGGRRLSAEWIFVNTGARPRIPKLPGLEQVPYLDSTSIMELGAVPEHLVILGGGFVGLEFGQMFRRFGSRVSILEQGPHLAPREDPDVCRAIQEILAEDGIQLHLQVRATSVALAAEGMRIQLEKEGDEGAGEAEESLVGSHLLVATGRVPNTEALNLGAVGLGVEDDGGIQVNDRLETGVPGIWALGDVNGGPPFTHVSYDDFRIIRDNLLKGRKASRSGRVLPYTLFIDPELGRVGLTETQAREAGHPVRVAKLPMERVARALERDETRGFIKAVVDAETDRILGAAALGLGGGELAALFQVAMMGDLPYQALREGIFAHPTLAESLNNLFASLEDRAGTER
jgi:pyruvate/2-oxoglutarate dehydrogenase complex dihydrolipoamide dehydrogenase (E3) component